jgi:hypothetical protein
VAPELLVLNGASEDQADSVAEAIICQQIGVGSGNIHFNGQLLQLSTCAILLSRMRIARLRNMHGSSFDKWGHLDAWLDDITKEDVCATFPRDGWYDSFARAIKNEMRCVKSGIMRPVSLITLRTKPWSLTTSFKPENWC